MGEATMNQLISMCNKVGWDAGIAALEKIVLANEHLQADLFANPETVKDAQRLSKTIIKQSITIGNLKRIRKELGI